MPTPTPVLNARERLIKSIAAACVFYKVPFNIPFLEMIAADLFGDPTPDITPAPARGNAINIGPVGQLGMWFALYCEEGYILPPAIMPSGISIDPRLLVPLLSLHPVTFEFDLHHSAESAVVNGRTICDVCKLGIIEHFEALEEAQVAKIESLMGDIEVMEATTDIQMQAIVKQTEAIEVLTAASAELKPMTMAEQSAIRESCPHAVMGGPPGGQYCAHCMLPKTDIDDGD